MARPARVRMRSRKPCLLARRRLFGWNVRLLTGAPGRDHVAGTLDDGVRFSDSPQATIWNPPFAGRVRLTRLRLWKAVLPLLPRSRYAAGIPRAQHVDSFVDRERVARDVGMRGSAQVANSDLAEVWARSLDGLADLQIQPHQRAWLKLTRPLGLVENTAL